MAHFTTHFISDSLCRITSFQAIIPNDAQDYTTTGNPHYERGMKTLYLLHGYAGNCTDWALGSLAQNLALKYNMAIVMPSGENSFYLDQKGTGRAYGTYIGEELVAYTRKVFGFSSKKEDTFIGGFSMGGFGAVHTALKYPETFSGAIGLSSAFIIHNIKGLKEGYSNEIADYDYYHSVFGDLDKLEESENNPEYLIKKMIEKEEIIPKLYLACGTEDFGIENNREFHQFLLDHKVSHTYQEGTGIHDWNFWNQYIEPGIQNMINCEAD